MPDTSAKNPHCNAGARTLNRLWLKWGTPVTLPFFPGTKRQWEYKGRDQGDSVPLPLHPEPHVFLYQLPCFSLSLSLSSELEPWSAKLFWRCTYYTSYIVMGKGSSVPLAYFELMCRNTTVTGKLHKTCYSLHAQRTLHSTGLETSSIMQPLPKAPDSPPGSIRCRSFHRPLL